MTQALYLNDSYLKEFDATVVKIEGKLVVLDKTAFYPESGGQLCDLGKLTSNDIIYQIISVKKQQGEIIHELDKEGLKEGDNVHGVVDWERRYKMMRMHTAAHVLSAIINHVTKALITGNQLGLEKSRIDFNLENFNKEEIKNFFDAANEIVKWNLEIKTYFLARQEAEKEGNIFKLAKQLPEEIKEVRIVDIESFDKQADGGTHVSRTGEVGKIIFLDAENKGKSNRRVYFCLEKA